MIGDGEWRRSYGDVAAGGGDECGCGCGSGIKEGRYKNKTIESEGGITLNNDLFLLTNYTDTDLYRIRDFIHKPRY